MENELNELNNRFKNYRETLLTCVIASEVIYEDDPKNSFNSNKYNNFNHNIQKIVVSETDEDGTDIYALHVKYMICVNDVKKQIIVAFRGTKSMSDFLVDVQFNGKINDYQGRFHSGIFRRSQEIPIQFFIDKIKDGYQVVFTGHSLGAAVAGLITIRILLETQIYLKKKYKNNILCIGFGSPAFADKEFKEFIEKDCDLKNNYHFYINENDIVVESLCILSDYIYSEKIGLNQDVQTYTGIFISYLSDKNKILNEIQPILELFSKAIIKSTVPNYQHFGKTIYVKAKSNTSTSLRDYIKNNLNNPNDFISSMQNHYISNYRIKILNLLNNEINASKILSVVDYDELNIKIENNNSVSFIQNGGEIDVCFNLKCKNVEYILNAILKLKDKQEFYVKRMDRQNEDSINFIFTILNTYLTNLPFEAEIKFITHFKNVTPAVIIKIDKIKMNEITTKQKYIYSLPLDLLYIYSIFFVNTFQKLNDEKLKKKCNEIKLILKEISKIWALDENVKHSISDSYLRGVLTSYFSNDIQGSYIKDQTFIETLKELEKYCYEDNLENVLKDILPTCLYLKKKQSKIFAWDPSIPFYYNLTSAISYFLKVTINLFRDIPDSGYIATLISYSDKVDLKQCSPYAGYYEDEIIKNNYQAKLENNEILKTIAYNHQLRNILLEKDMHIYGVIGKKKCGKSTFVEKMIPGVNANASANIATVDTKPYKITSTSNHILLDYPHFDSIDFNHKLQFIFSRYLLDHVFMVCSAIERMDSDDTNRLLKIIKKGHENNFTILLNRADDVWVDCKNDKDYGKKKLEELMLEVENRAHLENNKNLYLTCLSSHKSIQDYDGLKKVGVLLNGSLKKKFYEIIKLELNETNNEKQNYKEKEIVVENESGTKEMKVIITNDREKCKQKHGFDIIDSFEELQRETKFLKIENPGFKLKFGETLNNMNTLDDFLNADGQTFIAFNI